MNCLTIKERQFIFEARTKMLALKGLDNKSIIKNQSQTIHCDVKQSTGELIL